VVDRGPAAETDELKAQAIPADHDEESRRLASARMVNDSGALENIEGDEAGIANNIYARIQWPCGANC
jgi:hypothetical protein